ncbi:MAG: hypothetical protein HZB16_10360 [Armatimonadetes bacterium]|nr:hypothetical protein [Armatimonadota bacterium]
MNAIRPNRGVFWLLSLYLLAQAALAAPAPPERAQVGPRVALTDRAGGKVPPGVYAAARFGGPVELETTGRYEFTDCQVSFNTVWMAPARTVLLDHCQTGGIYLAEGGQLGWTLRFCYMLGGNQGLRPSTGRDGWDVKTPTPFVVEDCIVEISSLGTPTAHVEAMQTLGGNNLRFRRVRFITHGPKTDGVTGQTAVINVIAGHSLFEDCEFAEAGAYYYTVYCDGPENVFVRCRFGRGAASYLYPTTGTRIAPILFDCTDLQTGAPVGP